MADKALVEKIVASKKGFDESDREWLAALDDAQVAKIAANCGCTASAAGGDGGEPAKEPEKPAEGEPTKEPTKEPEKPAASAAAPEKPKEKTREEWLAEAPPDVRETVSEMLAQRAAEDAKLREEIAANSRGAFSGKDDPSLKDKPHAELLKLHKAVVIPPDNSGRGISAHDSHGGSKAESHAAMPSFPKRKVA